MRLQSHKVWILCTVLFCVLLAAGCEKAPERSDDNREDYTLSLDKLSFEQYITVEEAAGQIQQLAGKRVEGLVFPRQIEMPDVKTVSEVKLTPWKPEKRELFETTLQNLWEDYNTVDWSSIQRSKQDIAVEKRNKKYLGDQFFMGGKEDKDKGLSYSYDATGFFAGDSLEDTVLTCDYCVKEFDFEWGDTVSEQDVYPLADGELSVAEAVKYTENLLNTHLAVMEKNQFEYRVQHLYVIRNDANQTYDYNMVIGRVHNGLYIDTSSDFTLSDGKCHDKLHSGKAIHAVMRHARKLDYINTRDELFAVETESEQEKIISPFWAVQQIDKEIAHVGGLSFADCGLVYLLVQDNEQAKDNMQGTLRDISHSTTYLRPVWLFMSDGGSVDYEHFDRDYHGSSVIVDALDGSMYYYEGTI